MKLSTKKFHSNLVSHRDRQGMTQVQLADKSGLCATWISHFECGTRKPSLDKFVKLCNALNISPENLLIP